MSVVHVMLLKINAVLYVCAYLQLEKISTSACFDLENSVTGACVYPLYMDE